MPYGNDPANSPADELRLLIGDTDPNNPRLSDAEVAYFLGLSDKVVCSAYFAAQSLYSRYSGKLSKSIGSSRVEYGSLANQYRGLADELQPRCGITSTTLGGAPVLIGGKPPGPLSDIDWDNPAADYT